MKFKEYLISVNACEEAIIWNGERDIQTCWKECQRGDWMLWLMKKASMCDLRTLTLAKARCAELAKPYMKDERSIKALQAAFDFAEGRIGREELDADAAAADAAAAAADAAAAAYAADAAAYAAARIKIIKKCADICREVLPDPSIR